ncbi:MAG: DUF2283 domain-containing protein [Methanobrevibacter sp.]|nr:DUF2283 domain-containing protein [Methanobrevibacter sp.]
MEILNQKLNYNYDALADVLYIYVVNFSEGEEAIELNPNMYLTIDEEAIPSAIEILDASKILETTKFSLKRIQKIHLKISINKNDIRVNCSLKIPVHNNELLKSTNDTIINDLNLPELEAKLVMT